MPSQPIRPDDQAARTFGGERLSSRARVAAGQSNGAVRSAQIAHDQMLRPVRRPLSGSAGTGAEIRGMLENLTHGKGDKAERRRSS